MKKILAAVIVLLCALAGIAHADSTAYPQQLGGDVTGNQLTTTVGKVNGGAIPASQYSVGTNSSKQIVASPAQSCDSQFVNGTSSGGGFTCGTPKGGSGTVTSVGLVMPGVIFNTGVSNSPITSSGTLVTTLKSQTANYFLAAPNGSNGTPAFRAIVPADVPTLNQNTTGTAAGFTGSLSGDVTGTQSATSVVKVNGASVPISATVVGTNSSGQIMAQTGTISNNTTGTASNVTGTVAIGNGGTGLTTYAAVDGILYAATGQSASSTTSTTNLLSWSMPGGTLSSSTPCIHIHAYGTRATNTDSTPVALTIGSVTLITHSPASSAVTWWDYYADICYATSSTDDTTSLYTLTNTGYLVPDGYASISVNNTTSQTIAISASGATAGDIVAKGLVIGYGF